MTKVATKEAAVKADYSKLERRLSRAKTMLIMYHPFVGSVAVRMPFVIEPSLGAMTGMPTAATDGKKVYFHPDFVEKLTDDELLFLVAHEVLHPMFEHTTRRKNRDPRTWNQAADFVINEMLVADRIGTMPKMGLQNTEFYNKGGGTTDGIYLLIEKQKQDGQGKGKGGKGQPGQGGDPGDPGDPLDDCRDSGETAAELAASEQEWKLITAQAAACARMMGNLSVNAQRLVDEVLAPKVNWKDVFQRFLIKQKNDERTYARPNRRFVSQGIIAPSVTGEVMGEVVFFVDCSGSISSDELNQYAGEIRAAVEDCAPSVVHVIYFDSKVCHHDKFERGEEVRINAHGGGGTDFAPCIQFLEDNGIEPVCAVFLTDMYGNFGPNPPNCPLLWISTSEIDKAPFGEVVRMHQKQV